MPVNAVEGQTIWFWVYPVSVLGAVSRLAVSFLLGAAYGLLALETASPLAIPSILFILLLLVLAWRLNYELPRLASVTAGFVVGFALVFTVIVIRLAIECQPPSCTWAGAQWAFIQGALILLPPLVLPLGSAALRRWQASVAPRGGT